MVANSNVMLALGLVGLAGPWLAAGGVCSTADAVKPRSRAHAYQARKIVVAPKPTLETSVSFNVSELHASVLVTPDRAEWDAWEGSHGFLVVNGSKSPWHLVPNPANAPMRIQALDGPGLDGGLIVPPGKAIRLAFQSDPGPQARLAWFGIRDEDNRMGAMIAFTAAPPSPGHKGIQMLGLVDLVGRDYKDIDIMTCDTGKAVVGIKGNKYL